MHNSFLLTQLVKGNKTSQGLRINQVKYQVIRALTDENSQCYSVHGKKVSAFLLSCSVQWRCSRSIHIFVTLQTMGGCGLVLTGKCVLIATFDETKGHTAPACQGVLSDLGKHLKDTMP